MPSQIKRRRVQTRSPCLLSSSNPDVRGEFGSFNGQWPQVHQLFYRASTTICKLIFNPCVSATFLNRTVVRKSAAEAKTYLYIYIFFFLKGLFAQNRNFTHLPLTTLLMGALVTFSNPVTRSGVSEGLPTRWENNNNLKDHTLYDSRVSEVSCKCPEDSAVRFVLKLRRQHQVFLPKCSL